MLLSEFIQRISGLIVSNSEGPHVAPGVLEDMGLSPHHIIVSPDFIAPAPEPVVPDEVQSVFEPEDPAAGNRPE